jgi:hypothetical protein
VFPLAIQVQFLAGGIPSLFAWWLEDDMPLSPCQMAQYLLVRYHGTLAVRNGST